MPRINHAWLATRYRMLPGLVTSRIYRTSVEDVVVAKQDVPFVRFKSSGVVESNGPLGPQRKEQAEIHLYTNELNGWIVQENHIIHVFNKEQMLDSWWRVDSLKIELLGTRYNCTCTPTQPVE